jgi:hypothetical protein
MKKQLLALVIVAIGVGTLIGSLILFGEIGGPPSCIPCTGREILVMQSYKVNSPTNVTLTLMNIGQVTIFQFAGYNVSESDGVHFADMNWTGPVMQPNQVVSINILIDGRAFTFQGGTTYMITTVTARQNQFTFTITG